MDIVNKGKWNQSTAIQISPDGLQNLKSEGYVTKKYDGYGCIDKNTLFKFDVVQGPTPSIGDKVQYEAQRTTAASHWNATKVKVVQFAVPHAKQGPEPTPGLTQQFPNPYQQEYYQKNQNQLSTQRFSSPNTFNKPNINFITGGSNFGIKPAQGIFQQQQAPSRPSNNAIPPFGMAVPPPPVPMPQIVAPPTTVMYPQQTAVFRPQQNRFSQHPPHAIQGNPPNLMGTFNTQSDRNRQLVQRMYREDDGRGFSRRSRSPERRDTKTSRKKSRSPRRRSRSRSPGRRSRSPRRKRSPPRVRYSVSITKFNLMRPILDTLELATHYPSMYIPSDVAIAFRHGSILWKDGNMLPYTNPVRYHVMNPTGVAADTPVDSHKSYRAKVMLLTGIARSKLYANVIAKPDSDRGRDHLYKLLRFWCGSGDKELSALGGPWCPKLDGEDPLNPQTLINTAIRTVKSQIGLDLSYCKKWYKIVEVHYHRPAEKRNADERVERTIMYVPSVWDCQPSQEDWDLLKQKIYGPDKKNAHNIGEDNKVRLKSAAPADAPILHGEVEINVCMEFNEDMLEAEFKPAKQIESAAEPEIMDIVAEDPEDESCVLEESSETESNPASASDVKAMKVNDLRAELEKRNLSTKGLKIQLVARLQKAIKDEIENGTGPPASTDTDAGVKIKKDVEEIQTKKPVLSLEVQKKINTLMKRLGIQDKHIEQLPESASILLHPAKGQEVSSFSLQSLLEYNKTDKKERVFEVAIFAEVFAEMLQRHFAILLLKALIEAEGEEEEGADKPDKKRHRKDTLTDSEEKDKNDSDEGSSESKEKTESKEGEKSCKEDTYVHRPDLLLSFLFFDKNRAGYLVEDDILNIVHTVGLNISRSQIKLMIDKVFLGRSRLQYRKLCERNSSGGQHVILQDKIGLKEIEEVLLLSDLETIPSVKVEVRDAPATEAAITSGSEEGLVKLKKEEDEELPQEDKDVIVINGSYIPRDELPDKYSRATRKITALEQKVKDLEKQRDKLEKAIKQSTTVKHSFDDLEQEVGVRKKELDILSTEKIRSELTARKYKTALEMAKTSLNGVIAQISACVEESSKGEKKESPTS